MSARLSMILGIRRTPFRTPGGIAIADVLRRTWSCLIRRQWLFLYPLALSIANTLAFFAIYAAEGDQIAWSAFFRASNGRARYLQDHFIADFSFSSRLWIPTVAGVGICLVWALIQAPFFRAIVGNRYPLAPRRWLEIPRLFLFYLVLNLVIYVAPLVAPLDGMLAPIIYVLSLVVSLLIIFSDYVIVFEDVGPLRGVRRSLRLVSLRVLPVMFVVVVLSLLYGLVAWLFGSYYDKATDVFVLLPVSELLVDALVSLFAEILLVFLYEDLRRQSPARAAG
jgi:hypothetical protein